MARTARALYEPTVIVLVIILVVATVLDGNFWSKQNLENLLTQNAPLGIVAVGMTFVIIAAGFDLSVGAVFAFGAVVYASADGHLPVVLAVIASVTIGLVAGLVNGILVAKFRINAFVATLGTGSMISGIASLYTGAQARLLSGDSYFYLGSKDVAGIPVSVWFLIIVMASAGGLLHKGIFGRALDRTRHGHRRAHVRH
jgi:ribose/xylose/arabinose/galactoside ABC-type transport system permease subunit